MPLQNPPTHLPRALSQSCHTHCVLQPPHLGSTHRPPHCLLNPYFFECSCRHDTPLQVTRRSTKWIHVAPQLQAIIQNHYQIVSTWWGYTPWMQNGFSHAPSTTRIPGSMSGMAAATKLLLQAHATCLLSLDATAKSSAPFPKPVLSLLQNLHCKSTWCKLAGRQTAIAIVQNLPRSCIKPPSSDVPLDKLTNWLTN